MDDEEELEQDRILYKVFGELGSAPAPRSPKCSDQEAIDLLHFGLTLRDAIPTEYSNRMNANGALGEIITFLDRIGIQRELSVLLRDLGTALGELDKGRTPNMLKPTVKAEKSAGSDGADFRQATRKAIAAAICELAILDFEISGDVPATKNGENYAVEIINNSAEWQNCGGTTVNARGLKEWRRWAEGQPKGSRAKEVYLKLVAETPGVAPLEQITKIIKLIPSLVSVGLDKQ